MAGKGVFLDDFAYMSDVEDVIAVAIYRRTFNWQILATMIPGAALGVCLAYVLASAVPGWSVEIVLGVVSLAFSLQQIKR
jgi:uncharacterized membrane protein YfcA